MTDVPPFTLRQLAYFVAAARHGTIAAAARELHLAPSSLADALDELEKAVGTRLLVRRRAHGLSLTPRGHEVLDRARSLLDDAEELRLAASGDALVPAGVVRLGCYLTLAPFVVPHLVTAFLAEHPQITLEIIETDGADLADMFTTGELDLALVYDAMVPPHVARRHLRDANAHVVLPAGHPLAARDAVDLVDLADEPLVLFDAPPSATHTLSLFASRGVSPRIVHRTASFELVRTLVGAGHGVAVLIQKPTTSRTYADDVVVSRPIIGTHATVGIEAVWPASGPLTARAATVLDFLLRQ